MHKESADRACVDHHQPTWHTYSNSNDPTSSHQRGHSLRILVKTSKGKQLSGSLSIQWFSCNRFVRLKTYGVLWLQSRAPNFYTSPEPQTLTALKHRLRESWSSVSLTTVQMSSVHCLTDCRQSSETKKILFRINIYTLSWSNVIAAIFIIASSHSLQCNIRFWNHLRWCESPYKIRHQFSAWML